jgi:hypothetical protein
MSKLIWRTQQGAVAIPAGTSKQLGVVDVSPYSKIRVVIDERIDAKTSVNLRMTFTEGNELVAQLDVLQISPHAQLTRVYDVPGSKLTIFADAIAGMGSDGIDVLIYGN